ARAGLPLLPPGAGRGGHAAASRRPRDPSVIFVVAFVLVLLSVVLARGDLRKLGALRFRWIGLLLVALAVQILVISILHLPHALDVTAHIASYVVISGFLLANWRIPGMPILAL